MALILAGLMVLAFAARRRPVFAATAAGLALLVGANAADATNLATATTPGTGVAGVTSVNLTVNGLPSGVLASGVNIQIAPTCPLGASVAGEVTTVGTKITTVTPSVKRVQFLLPGSLNSGTYYVSITGSGFASTNCSIVLVTRTSRILNACIPTSSLAVALGTTVTAYVPQGAWGVSTTGVLAVPLEGPGAPAQIATANPVNSCSSNPSSGQTVCTANNTDVYVISGNSLTNTLTSSADAYASFSGGSCNNCGVAINALTNTAYIEEGSSTSASRSAIQVLNLNTNVFATKFDLAHETSENVSIDPTRGFLLSPNEDSVYDLLSLDASGNVTAEYSHTMPYVGGEPDSAGEDCTTGIALSTEEFTGYLYLANLSGASFTAGTPGSWTAPENAQNFPEFYGLSAGTSGISVAPGSSHQGIVAGEFGGNLVGVIQLPATIGTADTPAVTDYVAFYFPNTPDGRSFQNGYDPHTVTAYTSPNDGRAYGVASDWGDGICYVGVVDLTKALAATRSSGTHYIDNSVDLLGTGVVRYVPTGKPGCPT